MREPDIEREQVEQVFGLTGGELETEPWEVWAQMESEVDGSPIYHQPAPAYAMLSWAERYWYDGPPEHDETRLLEQHGYFSTLRTVVNRGGTMSSPQHELYDGDGIWKLVATYTNSGEAPCPYRQSDDESSRIVGGGDEANAVDCPLCDEKVGDEHGYIYLGVCAYEAVYLLLDDYEVIVGNVGTVHRGQDLQDALSHFNVYVEQSKSGVGRAGGEPVTLMRNGDVEKEYEPAAPAEEDEGMTANDDGPSSLPSVKTATAIGTIPDWMEKHLDNWLDSHTYDDDEREATKKAMIAAVVAEPSLVDRGWSGVRDHVFREAYEKLRDTAKVGDLVTYTGVYGRQVYGRIVEVIGEPRYGRIAGGLVRWEVTTKTAPGYSRGEVVQGTTLNMKLRSKR